MVKLSATTVIYNNTNEQITKIVSNLVNVMSEVGEFNLYLVNNSPDNLRLASFLKAYDNNTMVHVVTLPKNVGFGKGNNSVLKLLDSDYHFLVNPDVYVERNQIEKMVSFMNNNKKYGMLSPLIKFPNDEVQHLLKRESTVFDMALRFINPPIFKKRKKWFVSLPDGYGSIHSAENVPGSFMMFRTQLFKQIHGFDESYFLYMEDSDITMKVNQISNVVFFPNAHVYHEWQRENKKSIRGIVRMLKSMYTYFHKWGWRWF